MNTRAFFVLIFLVGLSGCNFAQDGSKKLSEEELYNFGLEASPDVYDFCRKNIKHTDLMQLCKESKSFMVISVLISIKDSIVSKCEIKTFDYHPETGKLSTKEKSKTRDIFINVFNNKKLKFSFIENYNSSNYDFRLNLNKFCNN